MKVLVADELSPEGLQTLRSADDLTVDVKVGLAPAGLKAIVGEYDVLAVRSATKVTADVLEKPGRLKLIGRAGVGVDNIDVEAASRHGIVVVNSPTGNIAAAAEQTVALLLALARHIPDATADLRAGRWERSRYVGTEIRGKTLGIVGLGKVGIEVARRAGEGGLGMRLLASDPYAAPEIARSLGVALVPLDAVLAQADFLTVHTSLTSATRGLIGASELARMKPSARVINCARGGVIEEAALLQALEADRLAGAALDVFTQEPPPAGSVARALIEHPRVIATPHLGASTEEAQINVALDVAEQLAEVLRGGSARAAVNAPLILPETLRQLQPWMGLVETLGRLYTQLHPGPLRRAELGISGEIAQLDTRPLTAALIKGLLESVSEAHVNLINAPILARDWGLEVTESRSPSHEQYANLVTVRVAGDGADAAGDNLLAATIAWGEERVVRVDRYATDFEPRGHILFCRNVDRPGMIGRVGTILGDAGVNIRRMDVGPLAPADGGRGRSGGGEALMVLSVDDVVPESAVEHIRATECIFSITRVEL